MFAPSPSPTKGDRDRRALGAFALLRACLTCQKCHGYLRDPYELECGCMFCHDCLKAGLNKKSECPNCGIPTHVRDKHRHPTAEAITKIILGSDCIEGRAGPEASAGETSQAPKVKQTEMGQIESATESDNEAAAARATSIAARSSCTASGLEPAAGGQSEKSSQGLRKVRIGKPGLTSRLKRSGARSVAAEQKCGASELALQGLAPEATPVPPSPRAEEMLQRLSPGGASAGDGGAVEVLTASAPFSPMFRTKRRFASQSEGDGRSPLTPLRQVAAPSERPEIRSDAPFASFHQLWGSQGMEEEEEAQCETERAAAQSPAKATARSASARNENCRLSSQDGPMARPTVPSKPSIALGTEGDVLAPSQSGKEVLSPVRAGRAASGPPTPASSSAALKARRGSRSRSPAPVIDRHANGRECDVQVEGGAAVDASALSPRFQRGALCDAPLDADIPLQRAAAADEAERSTAHAASSAAVASNDLAALQRSRQRKESQPLDPAQAGGADELESAETVAGVPCAGQSAAESALRAVGAEDAAVATNNDSEGHQMANSVQAAAAAKTAKHAPLVQGTQAGDSFAASASTREGSASEMVPETHDYDDGVGNEAQAGDTEVEDNWDDTEAEDVAAAEQPLPQSKASQGQQSAAAGGSHSESFGSEVPETSAEALPAAVPSVAGAAGGEGPPHSGADSSGQLSSAAAAKADPVASSCGSQAGPPVVEVRETPPSQVAQPTPSAGARQQVVALSTLEPVFDFDSLLVVPPLLAQSEGSEAQEGISVCDTAAPESQEAPLHLELGSMRKDGEGPPPTVRRSSTAGNEGGGGSNSAADTIVEAGSVRSGGGGTAAGGASALKDEAGTSVQTRGGSASPRLPPAFTPAYPQEEDCGFDFNALNEPPEGFGDDNAPADQCDDWNQTGVLQQPPVAMNAPAGSSDHLNFTDAGFGGNDDENGSFGGGACGEDGGSGAKKEVWLERRQPGEVAAKKKTSRKKAAAPPRRIVKNPYAEKLQLAGHSDKECEDHIFGNPAATRGKGKARAGAGAGAGAAAAAAGPSGKGARDDASASKSLSKGPKAAALPAPKPAGGWEGAGRSVDSSDDDDCAGPLVIGRVSSRSGSVAAAAAAARAKSVSTLKGSFTPAKRKAVSPSSQVGTPSCPKKRSSSGGGGSSQEAERRLNSSSGAGGRTSMRSGGGTAATVVNVDSDGSIEDSDAERNTLRSGGDAGTRSSEALTLDSHIGSIPDTEAILSMMRQRGVRTSPTQRAHAEQRSDTVAIEDDDDDIEEPHEENEAAGLAGKRRSQASLRGRGHAAAAASAAAVASPASDGFVPCLPVPGTPQPFEPFAVAGTGLNAEEEFEIRQMCGRLGLRFSGNQFVQSSAVLVVGESLLAQRRPDEPDGRRRHVLRHSRTYLHALLLGLWVVDANWARQCLAGHADPNEEPRRYLVYGGLAPAQIEAPGASVERQACLFEGYKFHVFRTRAAKASDSEKHHPWSALMRAGGCVFVEGLGDRKSYSDLPFSASSLAKQDDFADSADELSDPDDLAPTQVKKTLVVLIEEKGGSDELTDSDGSMSNARRWRRDGGGGGGGGGGAGSSSDAKEAEAVRKRALEAARTLKVQCVRGDWFNDCAKCCSLLPIDRSYRVEDQSSQAAGIRGGGGGGASSGGAQAGRDARGKRQRKEGSSEDEVVELEVNGSGEGMTGSSSGNSSSARKESKEAKMKRMAARRQSLKRQKRPATPTPAAAEASKRGANANESDDDEIDVEQPHVANDLQRVPRLSTAFSARKKTGRDERAISVSPDRSAADNNREALGFSYTRDALPAAELPESCAFPESVLPDYAAIEARAAGQGAISLPQDDPAEEAKRNVAQKELFARLVDVGYLTQEEVRVAARHHLGEYWMDLATFGLLLASMRGLAREAERRGCPLDILRSVFEKHGLSKQVEGKLQDFARDYPVWREGGGSGGSGGGVRERPTRAG